MPFYTANTLANNLAGFDGTWNYSNDILTYITPANKVGSLQVELGSRYSDGSAIIDIDGNTVPSYSATISVAAGSTVTVTPTLTGSSAPGVEVMYDPTESLTTVIDPNDVPRFVVPEGLSGSYSQSTSWRDFGDITTGDNGGDFFRPTRDELNASIASASSAKKQLGSTNLSAVVGENNSISDATIYGAMTIEELGGSWSAVPGNTSSGGLQVFTAEVAPNLNDGQPYGVDLIRTDEDQLFIPMDAEVTNNENAPPIMQVLPNVLPDRRVFTIAVDRNTVNKFSSNSQQEDNYAAISTISDGVVSDTTYDIDDSEYKTKSGNVTEIRFLTPAALLAGKGETVASNPSKDTLLAALTANQLNGTEYFTINQHCGPNLNASSVYRYFSSLSGGADELEYDGVLRPMDWDHDSQQYIEGEGGSYYQYVSGAVSSNPDQLNDNEWCLIHKSDRTLHIYYAPDYGDSSTPTDKGTFRFPVLSKILYADANASIENCEIACTGKFGDSSEGAITTRGSYVSISNTDIICNATGLRGTYKLIDSCNIIWASKRCAAASSDWDPTNTTGFHTIVRDSTFRFSQIQSGMAMLNASQGPDKQSPPILVERNVFCVPVTCHGQGLSLYKSAYQNATVRDNVFLDFTRAASFQDVSDKGYQKWVTSLETYNVRSYSWVKAPGGVQTPEGWKSDQGIVEDIGTKPINEDWGVTNILYDASGSGEVTLEFATSTLATFFKNNASPTMLAVVEPSGVNYDVAFSGGTVSGTSLVYTSSDVDMNDWSGSFTELLLSKHYNYMTGVCMPVRNDNSANDFIINGGMAGLKITNNLFFQGNVFSPPEAGQSYLSHNGGDMLLSNDDDVYPGRWLFESNTVSLDPNILTDPVSAASVDTGYNYSIFNLNVGARLNDFGFRPVLRNNVLSTWQVNSADEPNGITGFDGVAGSSTTKPVGAYSAYNGSLDFDSFYKARFPGNYITQQGFGFNDLTSVSWDKFSDVFDAETLEVSNQWATAASDGGKLGVRWSGTNISYLTLREAKADWWSSMNMAAQALATPYQDSDGLRRPSPEADYVIKDQDNRTKELTSVVIIENASNLEFTDTTLSISSTLIKESSTDVSYSWSLKRAGGGEVLFGATITPDAGDGSSATLYTGALAETGTEMDDLQIVLNVTTTNGNYPGWSSVSDVSDSISIKDSVPSGTAVVYTADALTSSGKYYRMGNGAGIPAWPSELLDEPDGAGAMQFRFYSSDRGWVFLVYNATQSLKDLISEGTKTISVEMTFASDGTADGAFAAMHGQSGTISFPAGSMAKLSNASDANWKSPGWGSVTNTGIVFPPTGSSDPAPNEGTLPSSTTMDITII